MKSYANEARLKGIPRAPKTLQDVDLSLMVQPMEHFLVGQDSNMGFMCLAPRNLLKSLLLVLLNVWNTIV